MTVTIIRKVVTLSGLAATLALSAFAALPVSAQGYHHHPLLRHASRLDRRAARAARHGRYRKASRLDRHAARLDRRAAFYHHY